MDYPYVYRWKNNPERARFYGKPCRVVARGKLNTVLLEFEDGERLVTSGNSIRQRKDGEG